MISFSFHILEVALFPKSEKLISRKTPAKLILVLAFLSSEYRKRADNSLLAPSSLLTLSLLHPLHLSLSLSLPPSEYPPYYILSYYTSLSLSPSIIPYFLWYLHLSLFLSLSFYRLLSLFCVSLSLSFFLKSSILFYLPPILCDFLIELYITFFHFSFSLSLSFTFPLFSNLF